MVYEVKRIWHAAGVVEIMLITSSLRIARQEVRRLEHHHADMRATIRQWGKDTTAHQVTVWLE